MCHLSLALGYASAAYIVFENPRLGPFPTNISSLFEFCLVLINLSQFSDGSYNRLHILFSFIIYEFPLCHTIDVKLYPMIFETFMKL